MIEVPAALMALGSEVKGLGRRAVKEKPEVMTSPTVQTNPTLHPFSKSYVQTFFKTTSNNEMELSLHYISICCKVLKCILYSSRKPSKQLETC